MNHPCIKRWFDNFIRSEYVSNLTSERDSDFINYPKRANRCYNAAEYGADGKTHLEVINDWRSCLHDYIQQQLNRNKRRNSWAEFPYRFEWEVARLIDECEIWHENDGSLYEEIG